MKCSRPHCKRKATLALLGNHPICRKCGDEDNRKKRIRSAARREKGLYPPSRQKGKLPKGAGFKWVPIVYIWRPLPTKPYPSWTEITKP